MKQNEELKQPFFAKLLESQKLIPSKDEKDPNPSFTHPFLDGDHTLKYPSDSDETGTSI